MITIRDVAKRLNLSITTVSRALDGYDDVAEQTRQLVIQAAQEMGYTPNRAARQLRRQQAETIGFILPADMHQIADPFFSEFIAGIGDEAAAHNYDLLVSAARPDSADELAAYRRWVQAGKVDGVVISRTRLHDCRIQYLAEQKMPFVSMERSLDSFEFIGVEVDSYNGFLELMSYLTGLGHRRIAYIGGWPELKIDHDRFAGYQAGLASAEIMFDPELVVRKGLTSAGGYSAAEDLLFLKHPPTAMMCINDLTAIGAMHAASDKGLVVGRDLAITGFDGVVDSAHTQPPLTTLEQPVYAVARQLVQMLLAQVAGNKLLEKQIKLQPKPLIRASTEGVLSERPSLRGVVRAHSRKTLSAWLSSNERLVQTK